MPWDFGLLTHLRFLYFNDGLEFQVRRFFLHTALTLLFYDLIC